MERNFSRHTDKQTYRPKKFLVVYLPKFVETAIWARSGPHCPKAFSLLHRVPPCENLRADRRCLCVGWQWAERAAIFFWQGSQWIITAYSVSLLLYRYKPATISDRYHPFWHFILPAKSASARVKRLLSCAPFRTTGISRSCSRTVSVFALLVCHVCAPAHCVWGARRPRPIFGELALVRNSYEIETC